MENSYIENFKSYTDWGTVIVRSNNTPLDRTSIFGSLEDAKKYAKGDGSDINKLGKTSYIGQFLAVHENGVVDIYQIIGDDTKSPIERSLRKVLHEVDLEVYSGETEEKLQNIIDKLIKQDGSVYDCENGTLTLATNNEEHNIIIPLTSNYGTINAENTEFNKNRLQFVHCDILFETSEEAKEYVNGNLIMRDRPALFAEPMVLKYGNAENPNILLAIGSVGDGSNVDVENKLFFIDCAEIIKNGIKEYKNSSTVEHNIERTDDGIVYESNVKLQSIKEYGKHTYENIILNEENGLFSYVDVELNNNKVIINVNGNIKEYEILNQILLSDDENNILFKRDNGLYANVDVNYDYDSNTINFNNGINEKNINLTTFTLSSEKTKTIENDIVKTKHGTTISSNVLLSDGVENILNINNDGLFATVSLNYNRANNVLTFSTTNSEKEIQLSSHSLVSSGRYDPTTKLIILTIVTDEGKINEVEIPVGDIVKVLEIYNHNDSPIVLNKKTDAVSGIEVLSAHLKISEAEDNAIKINVIGNTTSLYASNIAENLYGTWAVEEDDDVLYIKKTIQEIIGILQGSTQNNEYLINEANKEITTLKERINNLDFGFTEDELYDDIQ